MALYRTISLSFWTDPKIADEFTPEDRYFYLYLFTNTHTNLAGCYEVSIRQMVNETGYSKDTIERLLNRFKTIHKVIDYSEVTKEILLINWHKYNWTSSEKFRKPLLKEIDGIKNDTFKEYLLNIYNGESPLYRYGIDTICNDTSVTVTNTNTNNINNKNIYSISFENIYNEYPRKGEKKKAYGCFQARLKEGYSEEELLIATKKYAEQCKKENREQRYIKLASTFFGVNTPFVDYLPKGGSGNYSKSMEYGRKIYQGDESRTAPYFGFPPEWFEGEQLIEERITPLVCDKSYVQGGREDYEFTVEELKGIYESRKRGKQYEQCFDDIFDS